LTDILVAVGIGAVIMILLYAISASARTAQKGNAPVAEPASAPKPKKQQKSSDDDEPKKQTAAAAPKKQQQQQQRVTSASSASSASSDNNNKKNNNKTAAAAGPTKAQKKAAKKAREEEEAEMDAIVEAEMKRSLATGIRKEKYEVINLEKVQQAKDIKAHRQEKKAEGATFNEKQIASEKAAGFRVVGAQEAAKKDQQQQQAKSSSPAGRDGSEGGNSTKKNKKSGGGGGAMSREEELDAALRSVLSKRGNKRGGGAGGFMRNRDRDESSPEGERGFVELKGEVKASRPGGAWGRNE